MYGMKWMGGLIVTISVAGFAPPAFANTYFLQQDLGVHGLVHVCQYSNGRDYSFNATQLCPLQIEDDGPPQMNGPATNTVTGFLSGQYMDGMTQVCVYNVLGSTEAIRLNGIGACPATYQF